MENSKQPVAEIVRNLPTTALQERGPKLLQAILETPGINWHRKPWSSGAPVPVLRRGGEAWQAASRELSACQAGEGKASNDMVAGLMIRLLAHYWHAGMPQVLQDLVAQDFAEDLAGVSSADLADACRRYRRDPANIHAPKPGQLLALVEKARGERRWKLQRLQILVNEAESGE